MEHPWSMKPSTFSWIVHDTITKLEAFICAHSFSLKNYTLLVSLEHTSALWRCKAWSLHPFSVHPCTLLVSLKCMSAPRRLEAWPLHLFSVCACALLNFIECMSTCWTNKWLSLVLQMYALCPWVLSLLLEWKIAPWRLFVSLNEFDYTLLIKPSYFNTHGSIMSRSFHEIGSDIINVFRVIFPHREWISLEGVPSYHDKVIIKRR